jgi:hypothetical protein
VIKNGTVCEQWVGIISWIVLWKHGLQTEDLAWGIHVVASHRTESQHGFNELLHWASASSQASSAWVHLRLLLLFFCVMGIWSIWCLLPCGSSL